MRTIRQRTTLFLAACLTAFLSACGSGPRYVPVKIEDRSASVVSVRAEWLFRTQATATAGGVTDGAEVQYVRMSGNDEQELAAGQLIGMGGRSITGPRSVSHRADISYAHLAYRGTARWPGLPLDMDMFLGGGRADYRIRSTVATSAALSLRTEEVAYALAMGLGLRWWFVEKAAVEGRLVLFSQNPLSLQVGGFGNGLQTDLVETELALLVKPFEHVAVRGGYARMALTPKKSPDASVLDIRLGGPFLGLGLSF